MGNTVQVLQSPRGLGAISQQVGLGEEGLFHQSAGVINFCSFLFLE